MLVRRVEVNIPAAFIPIKFLQIFYLGLQIQIYICGHRLISARPYGCMEKKGRITIRVAHRTKNDECKAISD